MSENTSNKEIKYIMTQLTMYPIPEDTVETWSDGDHETIATIIMTSRPWVGSFSDVHNPRDDSFPIISGYILYWNFTTEKGDKAEYLASYDSETGLMMLEDGIKGLEGYGYVRGAHFRPVNEDQIIYRYFNSDEEEDAEE